MSVGFNVFAATQSLEETDKQDYPNLDTAQEALSKMGKGNYVILNVYTQ